MKMEMAIFSMLLSAALTLAAAPPLRAGREEGAQSVGGTRFREPGPALASLLSAVPGTAALEWTSRGAVTRVAGAPVAAAAAAPAGFRTGYRIEDDPVLGPVEPPAREPNPLVGRRVSFAPGGARIGLTSDGTLSVLIGGQERRFSPVRTYLDTSGSNGRILSILVEGQPAQRLEILPHDRLLILLQGGFTVLDWPRASRDGGPVEDEAWYTDASHYRVPAVVERREDGGYRARNPLTGEWSVLTPFVTYREVFQGD